MVINVIIGVLGKGTGGGRSGGGRQARWREARAKEDFDPRNEILHEKRRGLNPYNPFSLETSLSPLGALNSAV